MAEKSPHNGVSRGSYAAAFSYVRRVDLGYARVSIAKQDLERQIDALTAVGIARERIYLDKKSGATLGPDGDASGARAAAHGRHVGRPNLLDPAALVYAEHLRDAGHTMAQIVANRDDPQQPVPVPTLPGHLR